MRPLDCHALRFSIPGPQLRDAIHHIFPYRAREYQKRREGYRRDCSALCGPAGHGKLAEQITHLSHVLLWDPGNVDLLIRRGIAYYRVRHLQAAIDDLDTAVELSNAAGLVDLDALRYRALVYEKCHRTGKALADVDAVVSRSKERADPLAYACRSMLRSAMGDHGAAKQDLALAQKWGKQSLGSFGCYTSAINSDNLDLVHLALGWAASSVCDALLDLDRDRLTALHSYIASLTHRSTFKTRYSYDLSSTRIRSHREDWLTYRRTHRMLFWRSTKLSLRRRRILHFRTRTLICSSCSS